VQAWLVFFWPVAIGSVIVIVLCLVFV